MPILDEWKSREPSERRKTSKQESCFDALCPFPVAGSWMDMDESHSLPARALL
jgi:hypothetical protein